MQLNMLPLWAAALIASVTASPIEVHAQSTLAKRQDRPNYLECDGLRRPDISDCQVIIDNAIMSTPDLVGNLAFDQCNTFTFEANNNCVLSVCNTCGQEPKDWLYRYGAFRWSTLLDECRDQSNGGGQWNAGDGLYFAAADNPAFVPDGSSRTTNDAPSVVKVSTISYGEYLASQNQTHVQKRQQEGDTNFRILKIGRAVERPGIAYPIGTFRPNGQTITSEESTTETVSAGASVEVSSSFFGLMEASIGAEFSIESSQTSTIGISQTVNCSPQPEGILEWVPLWNTWFGVFDPSGETGEAWSPVEGGNGNYRIRCGGGA